MSWFDSEWLEQWNREHQATRADVLFGVGKAFTMKGRYIVNPDPQNPAPQLLSGHWRHVGDFVRYEHVCPGSDCAIARWIREHAK